MKRIKLLALSGLLLGVVGCANNSKEDDVDDLVFDCSETNVSLENDIMPILLAQCTFSGCHNGDNGSSRNWTVKANVLARAEAIKTRTQNGTMPRSPGVLTQSQIDLIACWVDNGALDN